MWYSIVGWGALSYSTPLHVSPQCRGRSPWLWFRSDCFFRVDTLVVLLISFVQDKMSGLYGMYVSAPTVQNVPLHLQTVHLHLYSWPHIPIGQVFLQLAVLSSCAAIPILLFPGPWTCV